MITNKVYYNGNMRQILEDAIDLAKPVLCVGETGTGKTSAIRELALERSRDLYRLNLNGQTSIDEILGKWIPKKDGFEWVDGLVIKAMKEGAWIVLDEVNAALPEILFTLHSLLDDDRFIVLKEKEGETIRPTEEFRIFATMNPDDEYAGTKELNKAFLSRFPLVLEFDYSDNENQIIVDRTEVDAGVADKLILIANTVREEKRNNKLSYTCSTRDLIDCASFIKKGWAIEDAVRYSIINKSPREDREKITKMFELLTGDNFSVTVGGRSSNSKSKVLSFKNFQEIKDYVEKASDLQDTFDSKMKQLDSRDKENQEKNLKFIQAAQSIIKYLNKNAKRFDTPNDKILEDSINKLAEVYN